MAQSGALLRSRHQQLPETSPEKAPLRSLESGYLPDMPDAEGAKSKGREEAEKFMPTQEGIPSSAEEAGAKIDSVKPPGSFAEAGKNIEDQFHLIVNALIASAVGLLTILCCAAVYRHVKHDPIGPAQDGLNHDPALLDRGEWRFGLFECHQTPMFCLLAWCCPFIRWGDTMRMAGLMGFWVAVMTAACLGALVTPTASLTFWIWVCLATYKRQQIRELFGIQSGTGRTYAQDCITFWCCGCCAIAQEARQLEEAWAVGHHIVKVVPPQPPRTAQRLF